MENPYALPFQPKKNMDPPPPAKKDNGPPPTRKKNMDPLKKKNLELGFYGVGLLLHPGLQLPHLGSSVIFWFKKRPAT